MFKTDCQKNIAIIIKMVGKIYYKEPQGSFKAYINKQNTHCLKCRKQNNTSIMSKQVVNKLTAQKSTCSDCGSKKSVFVKEYKPNKKQK